MAQSSKGFTSSFRGSVPPSAYAEVLASDFGTFGSPNTNLGVAGRYALLGGSGVTNTGASVISQGNVGSSPTPSITGFPPGVIVPPAVIDNANAGAAQTALTAAITFYNGLATTAAITTADLGTQNVSGAGAGVYRAGVFVSPSSIAISTPITLDAQGNPNALFVFRATGSTITQAAAGTITLVNGAKADNVIWVAGSSWTTVGPGAVTVGTILAVTSVTLGGGTLSGRALAGSGSVTISTATIVTAEPAPASAPVQNPLPLVPANGTTDYVFVIPNSGSRWRVQESVHFARPNAIVETPGIAITTCDVIQPLYPGVGAVVTAGVAPTSYMSLNGYLFQATQSGTTAATFIGFSKFNTAKGATTTDGTVIWTSLGKAIEIVSRFANSSATAATPVAQEYDFWAA